MSDESVQPRRPTRHPLYIAWGNLNLRLRDKGITPEAEGLRLTRDGRVLMVPYSDISEINLSMSPVQKSAPLAQMTIRFRTGQKIRIMNTTAWGNVDADQTQHYYRFKADLHERIVASGAADKITFTTGYTASRAQGVKVVMIIAAAFFVGGPIIIFIITNQPQALLICLGGAAFVWPFIKASERNAPGRYDPRDPPDMLA